jgi:hypothetical protein
MSQCSAQTTLETLELQMMTKTPAKTEPASKTTNPARRHRIDAGDQVSFARAAWPVWRSIGLHR